MRTRRSPPFPLAREAAGGRGGGSSCISAAEWPSAARAAPAHDGRSGAGLAVGLGWIDTAVGANYLFEAKTLRHFANNAGYHVGRFVLIGLVFAVMG